MTMRKLKLQVQMTVDGFVAGPEGQLDWMTRDLDEGVLARITQLTDTSDTILLGRKMTVGFINYWEAVQPQSPEYFFARKMVDTPKVVFSKTLTRVAGKNVRVESGDLVEAVTQLKEQRGKDIVVYGGATFESALDRKSTRLNSSHGYISYAVFCLKKKKIDKMSHSTKQIKGWK